MTPIGHGLTQISSNYNSTIAIKILSVSNPLNPCSYNKRQTIGTQMTPMRHGLTQISFNYNATATIEI